MVSKRAVSRGWEIAHGLNPHDPKDAALDSDGDGSSNLGQYFNGTDPRRFVNYLRPARP